MKFVPIAGSRVLFSIWETRVRDFEAFVAATGFDPGNGMVTLAVDGWKQRGGNWRNPGFSQTALHPVVGVNWDNANAFCAWLTQHEQAADRLPASGVYRLPTDLEWSAAVGLPQELGSTPQQRSGGVPGVYPWGRQWPPPQGAGNFRGEESRIGQEPAKWDMIPGYRDGFPRTAPVGSFAPNRFGIYDLSGNVWEWCADRFRPDKSERVLRGGSWRNNTPESLLSSKREDNPPDSQDPIVGFRCVLDDTTW
ncbi:MAG: SUMF1/EgtB/PvdO family nonheme iron enzyme [Verrucomicrobia bacterium]|nr:SUMF1/EgtB/PvdO family nonheme iron enzyme [Verrucomicrobiota bacterium]